MTPPLIHGRTIINFQQEMLKDFRFLDKLSWILRDNCWLNSTINCFHVVCIIVKYKNTTKPDEKIVCTKHSLDWLYLFNKRWYWKKYWSQYVKRQRLTNFKFISNLKYRWSKKDFLHLEYWEVMSESRKQTLITSCVSLIVFYCINTSFLCRTFL